MMEPATRMLAEHITEDELFEIEYELVEVLCGNCGCVLGQFASDGGTDSVMVRCPSCNNMNWVLSEALYHTEEHEPYRCQDDEPSDAEPRQKL